MQGSRFLEPEGDGQGQGGRDRCARGDALPTSRVKREETKKGCYIEVFADQALSVLTEAEGEWRKELLSELRIGLDETAVQGASRR